MQSNFDYGLPLAAHHHSQGSHHQQQSQQNNFGMSHTNNQSDDIFIARQAMFDAVTRLSAQLRNAADSCDAFVKAVARQNPNVAAFALASPSTGAGAGTSVPASFDLLTSMVNGGGVPNVGGSGAASDSGRTRSPSVSTPPNKKMKPMSKAARRRERKAKDPEAPKRPPSAYLLFQNEVRQEVRKKHPELPYSEVLGKVSEAWKALTDEQRKIYQDKTLESMAEWTAAKKERESHHQQLSGDGTEQEEEE